MRPLLWAETYADVVRNITQFHRQLPNRPALQKRLLDFKFWCYAPEIDGLAPMSYAICAYLFPQDPDPSPRAIMEQMEKWFRPAVGAEVELMHQRLQVFMNGYDKKLADPVRFFLPMNAEIISGDFYLH